MCSNNVFNRRSPEKAVDEADKIRILKQREKKAKEETKTSIIFHFSGSLLGNFVVFLPFERYSRCSSVNRETFLGIFSADACVTDF